MAIKAQAITVCYTAWNTSTNTGQTGDASNHTLKVVQDGTEGSPTNSPSEVDSTNLAGVYKLALTAGDMDFNCVVLGGKSSTSNVILIPLVILTERGNIATTGAPGASGGLVIAGSNAATTFATLTSTGEFTVNGETNVAQTGDSFARIGSTGSGLTSLAPASTALSTAQWTNTRAGYLDSLSGGAVALASTALSTVVWTSARAGYCDNLNVGGNVASHADASALSSQIGSPMQAGAAVALASTGLDAVIVETGFNAAQALAVILDMVCAKLSGLPGGPAVIRDVNDTTNRVTITFDGSNNRTAVTINPPSI